MKRDYQLNPLKRGEKPFKEDFEELFIIQNHTKEWLSQYFNKSKSIIGDWARFFNIKKPANLSSMNTFNTKIEKYGSKGYNNSNKAQETNLKRYGVKHALQKKEFLEKAQETSLEKYGCKIPAKLEQFKEKTKETKLQKYGNKNYINIEKMQETKLQKYGDEHFTNREKFNQTMNEKYGVNYPLQNKEFLEKAQETNLQKYGYKTPVKNDDILNKMIQTNNEKYGVEFVLSNEDIREKGKETLIEKYGVDNSLKSEEVKNKVKNTNLDRYGFEWVLSNHDIQEKSKETLLNRYGVNNYAKTAEYHNKVKSTSLKKFGVDHYSKTTNYLERVKETSIEKYGVDHYSKTEEYRKRNYETKKANNTFNSSKPEEDAFNALQEQFGEVKRQYKSEKYPFACDFYIPKLDLYIELNYHWTHGGELFDILNENHKKTLEMWQSKKTEYYDNAIDVWTKQDIKKKYIAEVNGVNLLVFYKEQDFWDWLNV